MVRATHVIFTAYGFWLPNDPRGSWSDFVAAWELFRVGGGATTVTTRRSLARDSHDAGLRHRTKQAMRYPAVRFDGLQARAVVRGFDEACRESGYTVHACSVLPEHVHLVVGRHAHDSRRIIGHLKARASRRLAEEGRHPFAVMAASDGGTPTPWARKGWSVFLDTADDVARAVGYVEQNPVKEGLRVQRWGFVRRLEG